MTRLRLGYDKPHIYMRGGYWMARYRGQVGISLHSPRRAFITLRNALAQRLR